MDDQDKEYKDDLAEWNNSPQFPAIRVLGIHAGLVNHPLGPLGDDELGQDDDGGVVDDDEEYFVVDDN